MPADLRKLIKDKEGRELPMQVLKCARTAGKGFVPKLVGLMVGGVFGD